MKREIFSLVFIMCLLSTMANSAQPSKAKLILLGQVVIEHDPRKFFLEPLAEFLPIFSTGDLVFTNLETTIKGINDNLFSTRQSIFHHSAAPEVLDFLMSIKINAIAIANNHSWDYGTKGILTTLREINLRKIPFAGAGINDAHASAPLVKTLNGLSIAIFAFATVRIDPSARARALMPGINLLDVNNKEDLKRSIESIGRARKQYDTVLVYHHFQTVGTKQWQRKFAKATIDAGADIYVSHGEPHMEGLEIYKSRPIFYNLGNFIFQTKTPLGYYNKSAWQGSVAVIDILNKKPKRISFIPVRLNEGVLGDKFFEKRGFPTIAAKDEAIEILKNLQTTSRALGANLVVKEYKGQVDL